MNISCQYKKEDNLKNQMKNSRKTKSLLNIPGCHNIFLQISFRNTFSGGVVMATAKPLLKWNWVRVKELKLVCRLVSMWRCHLLKVFIGTNIDACNFCDLALSFSSIEAGLEEYCLCHFLFVLQYLSLSVYR